MKFNIRAFNQEILTHFRKIVITKDKKKKLVKLDLIDIELIQWFRDFQDSKKMISEINSKDGLEYHWICYDKLVKEFPFLNLNKKALYARFRKICDFKIMSHYHKLDSKGSFSFYRTNPEIIELLLFDNNDTREKVNQNINTLDTKISTPRYKNIDPLDTKISTPSIQKYRPEDPSTNYPSTKEDYSIKKKDKEVENNLNKILLTLNEFNEIPIIELWNRYKNKYKNSSIKPALHILPKSKNSETSKIIKELTSSIIKLKKGTYFKNKVIKNKSFILNKKFTNEEIENTIKKYMRLFSDGYSYSNYEINKNKLSKNMKDFFYNPRTNLSYFLTCYENDVKKISEKKQEIIVINVPDKLQNMYQRIFTDSYWKNYKNKIFQKLSKLQKEITIIYKRNKYYYELYNNNFGFFSKIESFAILHLEYLEKKFEFDKGKITYGHLNNYGVVWSGFLEYIDKEYSITIPESEKEKDMLLRRKKYVLLKNKKKLPSDFIGNELKESLSKEELEKRMRELKDEGNINIGEMEALV